LARALRAGHDRGDGVRYTRDRPGLRLRAGDPGAWPDGVLADTLEDLVDAVKRVDTNERDACRRHVEQRFSVERLADEYEAIYRALLRRERVA
jgi:glycosyltransferase involved in cell wall biosynthesis